MGLITADDMGLGKTVTTVALFVKSLNKTEVDDGDRTQAPHSKSKWNEKYRNGYTK